MYALQVTGYLFKKCQFVIMTKTAAIPVSKQTGSGASFFLYNFHTTYLGQVNTTQGVAAKPVDSPMMDSEQRSSDVLIIGPCW